MTCSRVKYLVVHVSCTIGIILILKKQLKRHCNPYIMNVQLGKFWIHQVNVRLFF